ncbi:MAG TPA: hypothetical protein ENN19_14655 [Chloroflexi bacterium]|nr:hypothetical protein [Chloroflexota bacterium]
MLNLDLTTIVLQIVNFLIMAGVLYYLLFRPMMKQAREQAMEKERLMRKLAEERQKVETQRANLEDQLSDAEEEAERIINRARDRAEQTRTELLEEANEEIERMLSETHIDVRRMRRQAMEEFHDELLDAILSVSQQVIGRVAPDVTHDALVKQLNERIWKMGRSEMARVEAFRVSLGDREPTAYVTSAKPLSSEQQGELARTLTALADRHVDLDLRIDASLAAGLRVRLEDIVIDNTIAGQLQELRESVAQALKEDIENE